MTSPIYGEVCYVSLMDPVPDPEPPPVDPDRVRTVTPDGYVIHDLPLRARRPWVAGVTEDCTESEIASSED